MHQTRGCGLYLYIDISACLVCAQTQNLHPTVLVRIEQNNFKFHYETKLKLSKCFELGGEGHRAGRVDPQSGDLGF